MYVQKYSWIRGSKLLSLHFVNLNFLLSHKLKYIHSHAPQLIECINMNIMMLVLWMKV